MPADIVTVVLRRTSSSEPPPGLFRPRGKLAGPSGGLDSPLRVGVGPAPFPVLLV
jgi:hypothetical protein